MLLRKLLGKFRQDQRAYVAVIFGILALPLVAIAGAAVDYRNIGREYTNIRAAAEAAAVAAAKNDFGVSSAGETDSVLVPKIFYANYTYDPSRVSNITITPTLDNTQKTVTVTVSAAVQTSLLSVIGFSSFNVSVLARAASVFSPQNIQVFFVIDLSPSMGAPDDGTAPPVDAQGCFFMCHDDGSTMRSAGKTPKMDDILQKFFNSTDGETKTIGTAAANNPIPITATFFAGYFDHHFHIMVQDLSYANTYPLASVAYQLGTDGVNGGTDLKTSFSELHTYLSSTNPPPANTRRVVVIISDGMHARATQPFDPAVCTTLQGDGDIFTLYVNNPQSVYNNPNLSYVVPNSGGTLARSTWNWTVLNSGGSSPFGYYSGLNNAEALMKGCASKTDWAYEGQTGVQIKSALDTMAQAIIAPTIRVVN